MAETIKVLHVLDGNDQLQLNTENAVNVWTVGAERMEEAGILSALLQMKAPFELVILEAIVGSRALVALRTTTEPYRVLYTNRILRNDAAMDRYLTLKAASFMDPVHVEDVISDVRYRYYRKNKGTRLLPEDMENNDPTVEMTCIGDVEVRLRGDYGDFYKPVITLRRNPFLSAGDIWEFWPEYSLDEGVDIYFRIRLYAADTPDELLQEWVFQGPQLQSTMYLMNGNGDGNLSVTCFLRGKGTAHLGTIHLRRSRVGSGYFLPGGQRIWMHNREELFYQVVPGQHHGPLLVYFGGYNVEEGFHGYEALLEMGCPTLLLSDPRLKGGCFYLGNEEYESTVLALIRDIQDQFGLPHEQVVFAGQSMGAYAALYYAAQIRPGALVLGRPIANLGSAAALTRTIRPGVFRNAQDVLLKIQGAAGPSYEKDLDQRLWTILDQSDLTDTEVAVCYMEQDDYDPTAFTNLREHLEKRGAWVFGKGMVGRHDDRAEAVTFWMNGQLKRLVDERR